MSKIEAIFGGILLLAVVAAISFTLLDKGGLPSFGKKPGTAIVNGRAATGLTPASQQANVTLDPDNAICGCYERAFEQAHAGNRLDSVAYKSGYSACRKAAGPAGGEAWTYGWSKGEEGKLTQRSCRFYLNALKVRN